MRVLLVVGCLLLVVSSGFAQVSTNVSAKPGGTELKSNIGGMSIGYIKVGTMDVFSLAWRPDFKFGAWGLGADVNLALGDKKPANYESAVLRYVEYDDSKKGLRYGVLDWVTIGKGLVMKNYTTRVGTTVLLNNTQMGFKGYYDMDKYVARGLATRSNIYAVRLEERINPTLTLGQYYVTDTIGRTVTLSSGVARTFPSVSAIGADATMPLPANFEVFAEAGSLVNHGNGLTAGLSWAYDLMVANASFSWEYRFLDKGFVPRYFNVDYENNPVDLTSAEASGRAKNGYLAQLGINALGLASLNAAYESYADSNAALMADLSAQFSDQVNVKGYYKQPNFADYRSISLEQGAILGADVTYKVNQMTSLITHYKKAYNPATGQVEVTQYYEVGLSF